jgi:uncharacterized protein YndB with AHSA1/START domain
MTITRDGVIRVSRRLAVPPERAFDAWLDPSVVCRWLFATPGGKIVRCEIDARPGGLFVITDRRHGEEVAHHGTYLEVDRPRRIVFRFSVPKYSSEQSTVEVTVKADGAGSDVAIETSGVPPEWRAQTEQGWNELLQAVQSIVAE